MIYTSEEMEIRAAMSAAERICAAARTAPKAKGDDYIKTLTLTGADKDAVADEMERLSGEFGAAFFLRDAGNVRASQVLVLIAVEPGFRGLSEMCGFCNYGSCAECKNAGGTCVYDGVDVGIALGSAAAMAADCRVDSRILFSAGRAAISKGLFGENVRQAYGLPIAISGKSPFFDRKPKK